MLEVDWTHYNTYWNPWELGEHTAKYNLYSKPSGQIKQKTFGINPTYSWVLATDYETFIVEYHCQQMYGDFYTQEYVDIFVRNPDAYTAELEEELKAIITQKVPNLNMDKLVRTKTGVCEIEKMWGAIPNPNFL